VDTLSQLAAIASPNHFIGGQRVASSEVFLDRSPIDGSVIAEVARGRELEADMAVAAAEVGFRTWSKFSKERRSETLLRLADLIDEHRDELAELETVDNGALLRSHRQGVMPRVAQNFRFFGQWLLGLDHPDFETRGHTNHVSWDPAGVCVLITPWNAPLMLATWKVAPALAAGNSVVLKPAEWSPLTASVLGDLTLEAGIPEGVFNVVQGFGSEVGAALVGDGRIARISFTGSVPTARAIARSAAENITPLSFELGGKSPTIIFGDADLDLAVDIAVEQFDNAGQVCLAGTRILVEEEIADLFIARLLQRTAGLRQGDPREMTTDIGPQIHGDHVVRIEGFLERAAHRGLTPAIGGGRNEDLGGWYFRPTIFVDPPSDCEIVQEEIFGPVLTVQRFHGEQTAIQLANSTKYGLAATVVTSSKERADRVAGEVVAGTVWVNCFYVRDLQAPFGGSKLSGVGREGGNWSFDFYCNLKTTVTSPKGW
jgi:5-carboxymethyl-2-hydroxymuconic-semialdehyde dehydrogenase